MTKRALTMRSRQSAAGAAFALPAAAELAACFAAPLAVSLFYALYGAGGLTLGNFRAVAASPAFRTALSNTFLQLFVCLGLLLALPLMAALGLVYLKKYREKLVFFLLAILLLPMAVPSSVVTVFISDVFGSDGILNIGIFLWRNFGLAALLFYARIDALPADVSDAARIDGANAAQRVGHIIFPELGQAFLFVCIVGVWGVFRLSRESQFLFGAYPNSAVYGLQNYLNNHFRSANYAALSAASAIFLFAVSALLLGVLLLGRRRSHG